MILSNPERRTGIFLLVIKQNVVLLVTLSILQAAGEPIFRYDKYCQVSIFKFFDIVIVRLVLFKYSVAERFSWCGSRCQLQT